MQVIDTQLKKQLPNKKSISQSQVKLRNKKYKREQDNTQVAVIGVILEPARPRNINFWPKQGQLSNTQGQTRRVKLSNSCQTNIPLAKIRLI